MYQKYFCQICFSRNIYISDINTDDIDVKVVTSANIKKFWVEVACIDNINAVKDLKMHSQSFSILKIEDAGLEI